MAERITNAVLGFLNYTFIYTHAKALFDFLRRSEGVVVFLRPLKLHPSRCFYIIMAPNEAP